MKRIFLFTIISLLCFYSKSQASNSLCEEGLQNKNNGIPVELKNITLGDEERPLDRLMKALSSGNVRLRRSAINYLSENFQEIQVKYKHIYPYVYNRIFEVVKSDPNIDLQLKAFRMLFYENPQDRNLMALAEMRS